ncbi:hypothetical protein M5E06_13280 [Azospirillum sp. A1-3]|uniref:hypothetical protein n=1 Tax=Azospirillum sp. A1-3 TaxID=185874 RepID=UPI0020774141|nr:hypothetical protein [Azospirillum sp. A1-3]MCM8735155.1 hypothetical protein [Azospirillum sp. A1-3]
MSETMTKRMGRTLHEMGNARSQASGEWVARHLLQAMRAATGPMVQAGNGEVWAAMIDAALKEVKTP